MVLVRRFSEVAASPANLASGDFLLGVRGGSTDVRYSRAQISQGITSFFNVKNYGAVGDGVADDSAAILACVNAAYTAGESSVYFPQGIYRITQSGVLTQTVAANGSGLKYHGDGAKASVLRLDTSGAGADVYFYDNVATPRMKSNYFVDLGFQGINPSSVSVWSDIPNHAKGFRIWATTATGSNEQNFHFSRCEFGFLNNVLETAGDNTTSENSWVQCEMIQIKGNVLSINNVQSFNHQFVACNFTVTYGDIFAVVGGGGAIKMYGGSVIMFSDRGSDTYFFNGTATVGLGASPFTFSGIRFEARGNNTKIVNCATTEQFNIEFNNCLFEDQGTINKVNYGAVGAYSHVTFNDCLFYELGGAQLLFATTDPNSYNQAGSIVFNGCGFAPDWSDRCSTSGRGRISAKDCYGTNIGAESAGQHYAHDFDVRFDESNFGVYTAWTASGGSVGGPTDNMTRTKIAHFLSGAEGWPSGGSELQLKLPRNAIIKSIYLRKPNGGTDVTVCTMNVSRNDKSGSPHLTSDSQQMKVAQTGDKANYFYNVGTTTNERNLRLYTNVPTTGYTPGGFCFVEYI